MKKFKGILLALLSVVCVGAMAVGFAGCGDSEDENSSSKQKPIFSQSSSSEVSSIVNGSSVKESSSSVGESSSSVEVNSSSSVEFNSSIEENSSAVINSSSNVEDSSSVENSTSSMEDSSSILDSSSNNDSSSSDSSSSNNGCAHEWESITIKEATCTEKGLATDVCLLCGDDYSRIISALGHDYVDHTAQEVTCLEIGWNAYQTCSRCDYTNYEELSSLGHNYVEHTAQEPTCAEIGWESYQTCSRCDYTSYYELSALGHDYVDRICVRCEDILYSEGLRYELNSSGASYSVVGIGSCTDTDVWIPPIYNDLPVVTVSDSAFSDCRNLTSIVIPDSVTTIGDSAFYNCSSLASIEIPDSVTTIGEGAFSGRISLVFNEYGNCKYLGNERNSYHALIKVTNTNYSSYTIHENTKVINHRAFSSCANLTSIKVSENNSTYQSINGNLYTKDGPTLIQYAMGKTATEFETPASVIAIGNNAFSSCSSLTSVVIGNSVTTIGDRAFSSCSGLTSVVIGNSVTTIGYQAFFSCSGLTSMEIPDSVISIDEGAFLGCYNLTSVVIGDSVTTIGNAAFAYCSSLTSIVIPASVNEIGYGVFAVCGSLLSIEVSGNNSIYKTIDGNLYTKDGTMLIQYAMGKTAAKFEISDNVTTIARNAFTGCDSLTSVVIPDSVTSIGEYVFASCNSLRSITFNGTIAEWNAIEKGTNWHQDVPATEVVCSDGTVAL